MNILNIPDQALLARAFPVIFTIPQPKNHYNPLAERLSMREVEHK
jgi:hypothetical protein